MFRRRIIALTLVLLVIVVLLGGWIYLTFPADTTGLEGTWRDPADLRRSYQFRANGEVAAWYEMLPMAAFMTWQRDGQKIIVRTTRGWDFVGQLDGSEIRGDRIIRDQSGETVKTIGAIWRRD